MELGDKWQWDKRKLGCKIRVETGNPAADDLRERLADLAGVDLRELLNEMKKTTKKKKDTLTKTTAEKESERTLREVLGRSHILGAAQQAVKEVEEYEVAQIGSLASKNLNKRYMVLPKSPPRRVLLEIQRERAKPLTLPDQDENKTATAKLEKKLAKQRAARKAAIDRSAADEEALKAANSLSNSTFTKEMLSSVLPPWGGDLFGTLGGGHDYLDGMVYLSRAADTETKAKRRRKTLSNLLHPNKNAATDSSKEAKESEEKSRSTIDQDDFGASAFPTGTETASITDVGAKLYCATALCNWARNPANGSRLASEGAVSAIKQLSQEPHAKIAAFCAGAFRFMSENLELATAMIEENAIATMSDVINSSSDEFICTNLSVALVNLTRVNGKEADVVDKGIVLALGNLLTKRSELTAACARGLYNLTCVDVTYTLIERVIRALVSLSTNSAPNVKHICAAALCNLADLKPVRPRLVEEGVIPVLGPLARGSETRTRRVCAVILQNLSASKSCRVEMVSRNSVQVAYGLSSDPDPIILRCIGLTLSRLSMESANCGRIIQENGITALCNIAVKYPTIPGISQPVAAAFQLLSSRPQTRVSIVQEGSVTAMASLLRFSVDMFTLQHCLLALCNLLAEPDNHLSIVQQGMILTLVTLSAQENDVMKDFCALAFLNLSCAEESRKHAVNAGAVVAIIDLSRQKSTVTKARCAASLCNLSAYQQGMARMVSDGVIPALVNLVLADDLETVRYACAALCRLCSTVENSLLILESGAVPNLVQRSIDGDDTTQQYCAAVLSSLSIYESCRVRLCELNVISALTSLAELNDDVTKQRCLVAFANLSCEMTVQSQMVNEGVVGIIAKLAANSYQEINYICCAKALCNLACSEESRMRVTMEGGMHALLMISMVHSVDRETKLLCVIALGNLLDETTVEYMLDEGLVGSVANLSKIGDPRTIHLCAKLFNHLSFYPSARHKMVEKNAVLNALIGMLDANTTDTKMVAARTASNLVLSDAVRKKAVEEGALRVLEVGANLENEDVSLHCVKAIFSATNDPAFLVMMSKSTLPVTLCKVATKAVGEKLEYIVKILCFLAWKPESRLYLQTKSFADNILELVNNNMTLSSARWIAITLCYLCLGYGDHMELVNLGIMAALWKLHSIDSEGSVSEISHSIAEIVRCISVVEGAPSAVSTPETILMLHRATTLCAKDSATMYHIAVAMFKFAGDSPAARLRVAIPEALEIIDRISKFKECTELTVAALFYFLSDTKSRPVFANFTTASIAISVVTSTVGDELLDNAITCLFCLSKVPSCRELLIAAPLTADMHLIKLAQSDNQKIKANCARALKNMASDSTEAVEEGAVAALIAMSLEGKSKTQFHDELSIPELMPMSAAAAAKAPSCYNEEIVDSFWFDEKFIIKGGAAGKGPDSPEPPSMSVDGASQYPGMMEELDSGEVEGKTKMAFAKMQIPQNLRDLYVLRDEDFDQPRDDKDDDDDTGDAGQKSPTSLPPIEASGITPRSGGGKGGGGGGALSTTSAKNINNSSSKSGGGSPTEKRGGGGGGGLKRASSSSDRLSASGSQKSLDSLGSAGAANPKQQQQKKMTTKKSKAAILAADESDSGGGNIPLGEKAASLGLYN